MATSPSALLRELETAARSYRGGVAARKVELLERLGRRRLARAGEVLRLHEVLCFLRAYPDDEAVLERVESLLARFAQRGDVRRHRLALSDTGVAGTPIEFSFFWQSARRLRARWPERISVAWDYFRNEEGFERVVHLLVPYSESPGLDALELSAREWVAWLKGDESDAVFLVDRVAALPGDDFTREAFYDDLDLTLRLEPGPDTPARTRARLGGCEVAFQTSSLRRARPSLRAEIRRPPLAVRELPVREARRVIDLARDAMVTRSRDLHAFAYADERDVRMVECGDGLQLACIGQVPERRLVLESVYGFLTLKNGVPIGYVLASSLFGSTEIAYNVFDTFRGAEAAAVFGRVLGTVRHLFRSDTFSIDPYQLGYDNAEGLRSGAWWFYYKLGFRPHDPQVRRLVRAELRRMKADPRHRSSIATLEKLAAQHLFLHFEGQRADTLAQIALGEIGLWISRTLAERFGARREAGLRTCAREAAELLGLRSLRGFTRGERLAWERWSPLVMSLRGVGRWPAADRRRLVAVMRAKGGRSEAEFVRLFDGHRRLRRAVLRLAQEQ